METIKVGDYVKYNDGFKEELGRIKSLSDSEHVFVVYHCNDDWNNYKDYTGCRTRISDLKKVVELL
jgi:hypothetical protein